MLKSTHNTPTTDSKTGLTIVPERDKRITAFANKLLTDFYLKKNETPQEGFARAAFAWSAGDRDLSQRLYNGVSKGWFMFASPVLSNAPEVKTLNPLEFKEVKGLPISCFLTKVGDSVAGLIDHSSEIRWLSILGGGVGGHWRDVRAVSDKSPGIIPFLHTIDADMEAYRQGKTRRGSYAAYIDIDHPDIMEFINLRVPTGDTSRKAHSAGFHHGVNITDDFMQAVENDTEWNLVDPNDKTIRNTMSARKLWEQILDIRYRTGEPYLHFIDASNRDFPEAQKALGLQVNGSNLCSEITLATSEERTAVCCLSSLNLDKYDEWKDSTIVQDLIKMLDNVITYFIKHAPDAISRASFSAMRERSLGLGVMGFHHYLQKNMIPFESDKARAINKEIFDFIDKESVKATLDLGIEFGEAPDLISTLTFETNNGNVTEESSNYVKIVRNSKSELLRAFQVEVGDFIEGEKIVNIKGKHSHSGRRNTHLSAIAPTANSAILVDSSPSVEPSSANAFIHQTRGGNFPVKNKYLETLLEKKGLNTDEVWQDIVANKGSIQHLDFFTDEEKKVFKTAIEINQMWVVTHAADRQKYISQAQSINLFFPPRCSRNYFHRVHFMAWKKGMKSLYYTRTITPNRVENVSTKIARVALVGEEQNQDQPVVDNSIDNNEDDGECFACHG